jgi:hypothetical protein
LAPAIFGLVGVIIGGSITSVSSYLLDKRREGRERQKEERIHAVNLTTAARLVELDFRIARAYAGVCAGNKRWAGYVKNAVSLANWEKYCGILAAELSQDEWIELLVACRAVTHLQTLYEGAMERPDKTISEHLAKHLQEKVMPSVEAAQAVLLRFAGGQTERALEEPETVSGES